MRLAANEHLPLALLNEDRYYPTFWDSPSYAENLKQAYDGFSSQKKFIAAGIALRNKIALGCEGIFPPPGASFFLKAKALQKFVHNTIMNHLFPDNDQAQLSVLCERRWSIIFHPFDFSMERTAPGILVDPIWPRDRPQEASEHVTEHAFELLQLVSGAVAVKVFKTWLNGWATSYRMHEECPLNCLLGCRGEPDSLSQYAQCPHLYAMQRFFFDGVSEQPLIRFGIQQPCIQNN